MSIFQKIIKAVAGPLLRPYSALRDAEHFPFVIILLYHSIADDKNRTDPVGTEMFLRQLKYVSENYRVIALDEIESKMKDKGEPERPYLCITFDDGYLDNFKTAKPILDKFGFKATFFLATDSIGEEYDPRLKKRYGAELKMMNWEHVKTLKQEGHLIGSHTAGHSALAGLDAKSCEKELAESKKMIKEKSGIYTEIFSYPYGDKSAYTEPNKKLVGQYYKICCNNIRGRNCHDSLDMLDLHRYSIKGSTGFSEFVWDLKGSYDLFERLRG